MSRLMKRLAAVAVTAVAVSLAVTGTTAQADPAAGPSAERWNPGWSSAQQPPVEVDTAKWAMEGFTDQSLRQVVQPTVGGEELRVTLSNVYGERALRITAATVGLTEDGADVAPDSMRSITFKNRMSTVIPPGRELESDAVPLEIEAFESVTVTLYFSRETGPTTFHDRSDATSYRAEGNHATDLDGAAFAETDESWYYLADVAVAGETGDDAVVTFGDSITDGNESTVDADLRYPDVLAELSADAGHERAVLNAGLSGNRVLTDSDYMGERAGARFDRDVLDKPGVDTVVILEGVNDIGFSDVEDDPRFEPNPEVTAEQIIEGLQELVDRAHDADLRVVGGTLLPYKGAFYYTERGEKVRGEVNDWIRESGEFDAVVEFDRLMASDSDPLVLNPEYDSGDKLHPGDAGYRAMAEAVLPHV
ncbi:MAG: SGNH/GDSL hydrolase family protein [Stackebrandtia sp.]